MIDATHLDQLNAQQLRETVLSLVETMASQSAVIDRKDREIAFKQAFIDKLTHEMAVLKRLKFAAQSEAYNAEQKSLLEESIDTDLAALAAEIEQAASPAQGQDDKQKPKRQPLPGNLPRREIHHEPENTLCACGCQLKRIGPRSSTTSPACSRSNGTSGASGSAPSAKP